MFKSLLKMFVIILSIFVLVGCGGGQADTNVDEEESSSEDVKTEAEGNDYPGEEDVVTIVCDQDGEIEISVEELMELDSVTEEIVRRDDDGEIEDEYPIQGVLFKEMLDSIDWDHDTVDTIRLTAGDGYSVEVPNNILANNEVILAYEIDNEPLYDDTRPLRAFIPEEEAMYWVSNLVEIELSSISSRTDADADSDGHDSEEASSLEEIVFLETKVSEMENFEYEGEEKGKAVATSDLLGDLEVSDEIYLLASDGFDKNEELDTFMDAYILTQGEDVPAFRSPDLPRGMHVRDLTWISAGSVGFFSIEQGLEKFDEKTVEEDTGVSFLELTQEFDLQKSEKYILEAEDGYSVEIEHDDLSSGIVYISDSEEVSSVFDGLPRNTAVNDLKSIRVVE
ncbi:molybdopterin-dependent oxidoreductase [Natranaerobius trueperi]|uniref:Oxidoreductase molybdopterin-binding domain-containing protein n=1 Tax=Natranaerobius trueperi TaxID=759412 RepID=A0A226BXU0_9FIRM|nr:molybdopterin-dependent oxidoreductase [Natranaerobius trueperi]OWZ83833.1 hypothetical protein CDO51_06245 [Natranaerobius trueperi]